MDSRGQFDGYRSQISRRVNDSRFQKLLAHASARALYCDSERPSLGCLEIRHRRMIAAFIKGLN